MDEIIGKYIGHKVRVYTHAGDWDHCDEGVLRSASDQWLELAVGDHVLLFPLYRVRLVKPINLGEHHQAESGSGDTSDYALGASLEPSGNSL